MVSLTQLLVMHDNSHFSPNNRYESCWLPLLAEHGEGPHPHLEYRGPVPRHVRGEQHPQPRLDPENRGVVVPQPPPSSVLSSSGANIVSLSSSFWMVAISVLLQENEIPIMSFETLMYMIG